MSYASFPEDKPLTRLRETIQILRLCFSEEEVDFQGRLYEVHGFRLPVKPSNHIQIFGAAMGLKMVENVAGVADGVLVMMPTIEHIREVRKTIASVADKLSLKEEPAIACHLITAVSESREEAERIAKQTLLKYIGIPVYRASIMRMGFSEEVRTLEAARTGKEDRVWEKVPTGMASRLMIYGTPEDCAEKINSFAAEGVSHPIIYPCMTDYGFPNNVNQTIQLFAPHIHSLREPDKD